MGTKKNSPFHNIGSTNKRETNFFLKTKKKETKLHWCNHKHSTLPRVMDDARRDTASGVQSLARALSKSNDNPILFFVFSEIENAVEKSSFKAFLLDSITLWPSMKYVSVVKFRWLLACCSHVICMHRTRKKHALLIVDQKYFQILQGQGVQQCFSFLPSATVVPCTKRH